MNPKLENILTLVKNNPIEFNSFSRDIQQINPEARIISISHILDNINLPKNSTILDIGTGYGYGAVLLNALGYNVIGLEFNGDKLQEGMNYWNKLGIEFEHREDISSVTNTTGKLYFSQRDSRRLDELPKQSIDMVTAFYISGYMAGKNGAFREVETILKPQGNLTITTEGPIELPFFLRGVAINVVSRLMGPKNLKLTSTQAIEDPRVYDKFILTYDKMS